MFSRWLIAAVSVLALGLIVALGVFVVPFDLGKLGTMVRLRRTLPTATADAAVGSPEQSTVFVAFDEGPSADNLFYPNGREVYEQRGKHRLAIRFNATEPQWELTSYVTSIMYMNQRMLTLAFYPLAARASYRDALDALVKTFNQLGLESKVSWEEYERRLDAKLENRETYQPRIELPVVTVQPELNCRWNYDELPRAQVEHTDCYPIVYLTPRKQTD